MESSVLCSIQFHTTFGPQVHQCNGGFDFTLLFEDIFMAGLPYILLIIFGMYRLFGLSKTPVDKVVRYHMQDLKIVKIAYLTFTSEIMLTSILDISLASRSTYAHPHGFLVFSFNSKNSTLFMCCHFGMFLCIDCWYFIALRSQTLCSAFRLSHILLRYHLHF